MVSRKTRPRRSAEETRQVLVAEGLRQLERVGLDFGVEHLTLESACVETNVPRSSSHAAWSIDDDFTPQALYQRRVLKEWLATREGRSIAAAAEKALTSARESAALDIRGNDLVRVAAQAALQAGLTPDDGRGSGVLSTDMAIKHTLASQPASLRDPEIEGWVREAEERTRAERIEDSYRPMAKLLGLQPRPEYGDAAYRHVAIAIAALTEGITLRELVTPELGLANDPVRDVETDTAPATLLGVCVEALVEKFFEPAIVDGDQAP